MSKTSIKSPYKEVKTHPSKILGWENKSRKDPKKERKTDVKN